MGAIIPFPNHQQRKQFKQQKVIQKRQKIFSKLYALIKICFSKIWYFIRVAIANILHIVTTFCLGVFYELRKWTFLLLCIACVLNYFHLEGYLITRNNFLVPFFATISFIAFSSKKIINKIHEEEPFHCLLGCKRMMDETQPDGNTEYIILERVN